MALRFRATRDRVVVDHWYLCRRAARRFVRCGLERADLEQVAAIGLIKAADRYDRAQRAPFEAYAWLLVIGELMHYVRDSQRVIRAPRGARDLARRWRAAERDLWLRFGREPKELEVAQLIGATPAQVREVQAYRARSCVISLEVLGGTHQRMGSEGIEDVIDRLTVDRILAALPPIQRQIMRFIHLDGVTVVEVARRLGYSRRHITRLHRAAIERLRVAVTLRAEERAECLRT